MQDIVITRKQELAEKVNLQFDEVAEIFSEETLESVFLVQVVGGSNTGCNMVASCGCGSNSVASCGSTNTLKPRSSTVLRLKIYKYIRCFCKLKTWVKIILLILHLQSFAQRFTPQQLVEDAKYFFEAVEQIHPNPYAFKTIGYVESLKASILDQLSTIYDLDKNCFFRIIGTINHCFDMHTGILGTLTNHFGEEYLAEDGKILRRVNISNENVYLMVDGENVRLKLINGVPVIDILSKLNLYFSAEHTSFNQLILEHIFSYFLLFYHIKSPFELEGITTNGKQLQWTEMGETSTKNTGKTEKYECFILNDSIALLELNSFNDFDYDRFSFDMVEFFDSVIDQGIKHLFVDLTRNSGGKLSPSLLLLDFIKHDNIFYSYETVKKISRQSRDLGFISQEEDIGKMLRKTYNKSVLKPSQPSGYTGNLYFLQGLGTTSAADQFCRIIAQNNLGLRIGRETGTPVEFYSYTWCDKLPNTELNFCVALYFYNIPVPTAREGLVYPDIEYSLDGVDLRDVNELKKILNFINKQ